MKCMENTEEPQPRNVGLKRQEIRAASGLCFATFYSLQFSLRFAENL